MLCYLTPWHLFVFGSCLFFSASSNATPNDLKAEVLARLAGLQPAGNYPFRLVVPDNVPSIPDTVAVEFVVSDMNMPFGFWRFERSTNNSQVAVTAMQKSAGDGIVIRQGVIGKADFDRRLLRAFLALETQVLVSETAGKRVRGKCESYAENIQGTIALRVSTAGLTLLSQDNQLSMRLPCKSGKVRDNYSDAVIFWTSFGDDFEISFSDLEKLGIREKLLCWLREAPAGNNRVDGELRSYYLSAVRNLGHRKALPILARLWREPTQDWNTFRTKELAFTMQTLLAGNPPSRGGVEYHSFRDWRPATHTTLDRPIKVSAAMKREIRRHTSRYLPLDQFLTVSNETTADPPNLEVDVVLSEGHLGYIEIWHFERRAERTTVAVTHLLQESESGAYRAESGEIPRDVFDLRLIKSQLAGTSKLERKSSERIVTCGGSSRDTALGIAARSSDNFQYVFRGEGWLDSKGRLVRRCDDQPALRFWALFKGFITDIRAHKAIDSPALKDLIRWLTVPPAVEEFSELHRRELFLLMLSRHDGKDALAVVDDLWHTRLSENESVQSYWEEDVAVASQSLRLGPRSSFLATEKGVKQPDR